jgi:hypothetical protein
MSSPNAELQGRMSFSSRLSKVVDRIITETLDHGELSEATKEQAHRAGWLALTGNEETQAHRVPCSLLGADEAQIDSIAPVGMDKEYQKEGYYVSCDLYSGGKPYILNGDSIHLQTKEARVTEQVTPSRYVIFAGPEVPPTAVLISLLTEVSEQDPYNFSAMNQASKTFGRQALHQLTAADCQSLLGAVQLSADASSVAEFRAMFGS